MVSANSEQRLTFSNAIEVLKKNNIDPAGANPCQGYLRLEAPIRDAVTATALPILQNVSYNGIAQSKTEVRLSMQDNFVAGSMGYFLQIWHKPSQAPATELMTYLSVFNTANNWGQNNTLLGNAAPAAYTPQTWAQFWESTYMKFSINYNVIIPQYDLLRHHVRPQTQAGFNFAGAPLPIASETVAYNTYTADEKYGESTGFYPIEPNVVISGAKNTEISIINQLATSFEDLGITLGANYELKYVVIFRGVLLQNTTSVK